MLWNRSLPFLLIILASQIANSEWLGLPDQLKNVQIFSILPLVYRNEVTVKWICFESDVTSYNVHVMSQHNGTMRNVSVESNQKPMHDYCDFSPCSVTYLPSPSHDVSIGGLEEDETYVITVSAVNRRGEGPPSPALYYINRLESFSLLPQAPGNVRIASNSGNRVNVTWYQQYPPRLGYILHYADTKNLSVWNKIYTKDQSLVLDNFQNGSLYNFYVEASRKSEWIERGFTIPILANGEDMTGLPEPVITVQPDKRYFFHGEKMKIKCTLPPNTHMKGIEILLTFGSLSVRRRGLETWATLITTADELIDTTECVVSYDRYGWELITRRTSKTWKVYQDTNEENEKIQRLPLT